MALELLQTPKIVNGKSKDYSNKVDQIFKADDIKDSISIPRDLAQYGFFIKGSKYWTTVQKGKNSYDVILSNFVMKSLYHLVNGSNNSQRLILLQRSTGEKYLIVVFSNELKPESFETILKSNRCTFQGSPYQLKLIFSN